MKEVYSSGLLTVTKSLVDDKYTIFANRMPILITTAEGALALATAIFIEEAEMSSWMQTIEEVGLSECITVKNVESEDE